MLLLKFAPAFFFSLVAYLFTTFEIPRSQAPLDQNIPVCGIAAIDEFTAFTQDPGFRNSHELPRAFLFDQPLGKMMTYPTPDDKEANAYFVKAKGNSDRYLLVIHEWWGLNGHIKEEADKLFKDLEEEVNILALDMYDGNVATTREEAGKYMQNVSSERAINIIEGAQTFAGNKAKIATIGWCFGGAWSLQASLRLEKQAVGCVMYYGMPEKDVEQLKKLQTEVLGIFAAQEQWITPEVVAEFEQNMKRAGKKLTVKSYQADHAFANPSSPRYHEQAAQDAYKHTLAFLKKKLL
ncbi:dienelactone hydrolase family protein [Rapidithrix thailandica]|uniref:Dienelactone hydrolase family protein n=1 Tax=Rapidithrix thailandica TaxID=413964 RepID=A0AAW9SG58_9BACT